MATKQERIDEVVAKAWKGWYAVQNKAPLTGADGNTVNRYVITYAEFVGGIANEKNVLLYVYNEGVVAGPQVDENGDPVLDASGNQIVIPADQAEDAEWQAVPKKKDTARAGVQTFLEGLPNVVRARIDTLDEDEKFGFATLWQSDNNATATEKRVLYWTNGGLGALQARELV